MFSVYFFGLNINKYILWSNLFIWGFVKNLRGDVLTLNFRDFVKFKIFLSMNLINLNIQDIMLSLFKTSIYFFGFKSKDFLVFFKILLYYIFLKVVFCYLLNVYKSFIII